MGELWDTKAFQAGNRSCKGLEAELQEKSKEARAEGPSAGERAREESQEEAEKALKVL